MEPNLKGSSMLTFIFLNSQIDHFTAFEWHFKCFTSNIYSNNQSKCNDKNILKKPNVQT